VKWYSDPNVYSFAGPGPVTAFEVFAFRIEVVLKMLVICVLIPSLALGGLALAIWHARESYGIERHERYRRLVMYGLPAAGLILLVDVPWIVDWLSIRR
jgi:hypothetical protein